MRLILNKRYPIENWQRYQLLKYSLLL